MARAMGRRAFFGAAAAAGAAYGVAGSRAVESTEADRTPTGAPPYCEVVPEAGKQAVFRFGGEERLRWNFGTDYPRPFFYPVRGPSGAGLTRMGHPGAADHDHHQSIWFAHDSVDGHGFWSNQSPGVIRQKEWLAYQDGDSEAVMAALLSWRVEETGAELLEQELIAAARPAEDGGTLLEIGAEFRPAGDAVAFGQTNFGFLAVRVAKSLSAYFGGGRLVNSEGGEGEEAVFGERARWMDYSGPVAVGTGQSRRVVTEGLAYISHPDNPAHPPRWHVRSDGWMGAAHSMDGPLTAEREAPLRLRWLIHAHAGPADPGQTDALAEAFAATSPYEVAEDPSPHTRFTIRRR